MGIRRQKVTYFSYWVLNGHEWAIILVIKAIKDMGFTHDSDKVRKSPSNPHGYFTLRIGNNDPFTAPLLPLICTRPSPCSARTPARVRHPAPRHRHPVPRPALLAPRAPMPTRRKADLACLTGSLAGNGAWRGFLAVPGGARVRIPGRERP